MSALTDPCNGKKSAKLSAAFKQFRHGWRGPLFPQAVKRISSYQPVYRGACPFVAAGFAGSSDRKCLTAKSDSIVISWPPANGFHVT